MSKSKLLDRLKGKTNKAPANFLDKMTPKARKELYEIREAWDAGQITVTASDVYDEVRQDLGIQVNRDTFRRWLNGYQD